MISGISELVISVNHANARHLKPDKSNRAKNPERQNDGQWSIVIVAHHLSPFEALPDHCVFSPAKGVTFADQKVLRDLRYNLAPHLPPPLARSLRIHSRQWIEMDSRQNCERTLIIQGQVRCKDGGQPSRGSRLTGSSEQKNKRCQAAKA